jgi:prolipoprotein diacylglyceryltransferase
MIFVILWNIRKRISIPGILFSIYLVLNGMERFTIEIIRVNPQYEVLGISLSQAQLIALGLILSGCVGIWFFYTKRHQHLGNPVK